MANPTYQVPSTFQKAGDDCVYWPVDPSANTTFYTGESIGKNAAGYATHFDDSASLEFLGILAEQHQQFYSTDVGLVKFIRVRRPPTFTFPLLTGTVSRVDANGTTGAGAIGKTAYAYDSGHCVLSSSNLTYGNVLGEIVDIGDPGVPTNLNSTYSVVIAPAPPKGPGVLYMAATGDQTLGLTACGKTVFVPSSANLTLTLPPAALTNPGVDKITVIKTTSGAGNTSIVTLDGYASELVNGSTTATVVSQFDVKVLVSNGTSGWIVQSQVVN